MSDVSIHPNALVEEGVQLGAGCVVHPGAILRRGTVLGERVVVHPYAVIGGDPQDLKFDPATPSGVRVGAGTVLREFVTLHRSTQPGGWTTIGAGCFFMASSHAAHDCTVEDHVVLANAALLAGHVHVGAHCFLGGGAAVHQFGRVGRGAMIAGLARVPDDVPPFVLVAERSEVVGLNLVGLKRRGVPRETVRELKALYRKVYYTPGNIRRIAAAALAADEATTPEGREFLEFFTTGRRPISRVRREPARTAAEGGDDAAAD
jgi:UDP-N-acetylglucosamine acyltransferase